MPRSVFARSERRSVVETDWFDRGTRLVASAFSRRTLASVLGLGALGLPSLAAGKKRRKNKKIKRNSFGCVNVGNFCKDPGQCCSGICQGKKGKKRCRAHDTGGCQPASLCTFFGAEGIPCTTSSAVPGQCGTTTGNAGYCVGVGDCFPCAKDADCHDVCGPHAACVQCPEECEVGTVCAAPDDVVCPL
jgi:hypothetical protein